MSPQHAASRAARTRAVSSSPVGSTFSRRLPSNMFTPCGGARTPGVAASCRARSAATRRPSGVTGAHTVSPGPGTSGGTSVEMSSGSVSAEVNRPIRPAEACALDQTSMKNPREKPVTVSAGGARRTTVRNSPGVIRPSKASSAAPTTRPNPNTAGTACRTTVINAPIRTSRSITVSASPAAASKRA